MANASYPCHDDDDKITYHYSYNHQKRNGLARNTAKGIVLGIDLILDTYSIENTMIYHPGMLYLPCRQTNMGNDYNEMA